MDLWTLDYANWEGEAEGEVAKSIQECHASRIFLHVCRDLGVNSQGREATLQLGVFSILIKDSEKECLRVGACIKYALMIRRALFESFQPQVTLFYPQIRKEIKNKKGKF